MNGAPTAAFLPDGRRLHFQHGPIDLVIEVFSDDPAEIKAAYIQAWDRFQTILSSLLEELTILRLAVTDIYPLLRGPVARRMAAAVWPYRSVFITPMAAVAGSVADEVMAAMVAGRKIAKAYINNGGDIALYLTAGQSLRAGIVDHPDKPALNAQTTINFTDPIRGVATSGWRGRSQSLGIADAVTVLAETAAMADAAATMIANAVNVEDPAIERKPAHMVKDDSDLGALLVTTGVEVLGSKSVEKALASGLQRAAELHNQGLIEAAYLSLQGQQVSVDPSMEFKAIRELTG